MNVKIRNNYGMELKAIGRVEEARRQYLVSNDFLKYGNCHFEMQFLGNIILEHKCADSFNYTDNNLT